MRGSPKGEAQRGSPKAEPSGARNLEPQLGKAQNPVRPMGKSRIQGKPQRSSLAQMSHPPPNA